jgi:hypothetical protein
MRTINKIFILVLLLFCSSANPQGVKDTASGGFPLSIYTIECRPIGGDNVLDYRTHYSQYSIDNPRFNFEVKIRLKSEDIDSIPDSTIGVIIQTWSGEKEKYVFHPKNYIQKISKNYYEYYFLFESDKISTATFNIVSYNKTDNSFGPIDHSNTNYSRSFLLR